MPRLVFDWVTGGWEFGGTSLEFPSPHCVNTLICISQIWVSFSQCQVSASIPGTYWNLREICSLSLPGCWLFQTCSSISVLSPEVFYKFFSDPPHFLAVCPSSLPVLLTERIEYFTVPLSSEKLSTNSLESWIPRQALMAVENLRTGDPVFLSFVIFRDPLRIYF